MMEQLDGGLDLSFRYVLSGEPSFLMFNSF